MEPAPTILPASFWFRWRLSCPRIGAPDSSVAPRLHALPETACLPIPSAVDGAETWWELRAGWGPEGLALALEVRGGRSPAPIDPDYPELCDGLEFWIDTRDTRDIHRATRYCHRFLARVATERKNAALTVHLEQRKIHRSLEDAPIQRPTKVRAAAGRLPDGWWLDLEVPAANLNGYDPETNPRLGFSYALHDVEHGDRFLGPGREFPVTEDPSLWATLELQDATIPTSAAPAPKKRARR